MRRQDFEKLKEILPRTIKLQLAKGILELEICFLAEHNVDNNNLPEYMTLIQNQEQLDAATYVTPVFIIKPPFNSEVN